jgi:acyl carrier protein
VSTSDNGLVDQVLVIVRDILAKPHLTADDEVMDHGGTSLSVVRILMETQKKLELSINPRDLHGAVTARSLARAAR